MKAVVKAETMEAASGLIASIFKSVPYPFNLLLAAGAGGAVNVAMDKALAQVPSFAQGGMIEGKRHSDGGTLIEAEQGEFIINREAVKSLGIPTMNTINTGNIELVKEKVEKFKKGGLIQQYRNSSKEIFEKGGAVGITPLTLPDFQEKQSSNVNVTFNSPIMSADYTEDTIIPQIKSAVRRGASLGIS